jgi:hypothetical protein
MFAVIEPRVARWLAGGLRPTMTQRPAVLYVDPLYPLVGLTRSVVGGLLAGIVFKQDWRRASPGDRSDPPNALESEYDLKRSSLLSPPGGHLLACQDPHRPRRCPGSPTMDWRMAR